MALSVNMRTQLEILMERCLFEYNTKNKNGRIYDKSILDKYRELIKEDIEIQKIINFIDECIK